MRRPKKAPLRVEEMRARIAADFNQKSAGLAPPPRSFDEEDRYARERLLFPYDEVLPRPPDP